MDRLLARIALGAIATLASLLVAEGVARFALPSPRYFRHPLELDPGLGFRGVPLHRQTFSDDIGSYEVRLNSQGLRGREVPTEGRSDAAERVAFVGDSFLVAEAVRDEDLVTSRIESALRARGRDAAVYNLSVVDYGTGQELLLLRRLGRRIAPDAVVLFVYPANDVINNSLDLAERTAVSPGDPLRPYLSVDAGELRVRYLHPLRAFLRRHSALFAHLELLWFASVRAPDRPADGATQRLGLGKAPREDLEIFRARQESGGSWESAWKATYEMLRAFREECDRLGARLLVVVVPSHSQVVRTPQEIALDLVSRSRSRRGLDSLLDWNLPERRLARFFAEEGIEARFLLGPLRDAAAAGATVYSRDEHLAPDGHAIAAGIVLAWIDGVGAAPPELQGRPIQRLPEASHSPAWLDFRERAHADHLGDGWVAWTPPGSEAPSGWLIGPRALAVLPAGAGDLVVRGIAPGQARFPIVGAIRIVGGTRLPLRIERPGPFELRLPSGPPPTSQGYVAVMLEPGNLHADDAMRLGLVIEEIGFDRPQPDASSLRGGR